MRIQIKLFVLLFALLLCIVPVAYMEGEGSETSTEAPITQPPVTSPPATEVPPTVAPPTEVPATEVPATEAPATEAPATEAPPTTAPTLPPIFDPTAEPTAPAKTSDPHRTPAPYPRVYDYSGVEDANTTLFRQWHGKTLLAFGDSIMYGAGAGGCGPARLFGEIYGMHVVDYSRNGAFLTNLNIRSSKLIIHQIELAVDEQAENPIDLILLQGGCNDIYADCTIGMVEDIIGGVDTDTMAGSLEYCVIALRETFPEAEIVLVHPHYIKALDAAAQTDMSEVLQDCCEKWGTRCANISKYMSTIITDESDVIYNHPNRAQYTEFYIPCIEETLLLPAEKGWAEP